MINERKTFYDDDCLSFFLRTDSSFILKKLFNNVLVPNFVYDEFCNPGTPKKVIKNFEELKNDGFIEIVSVDMLNQMILSVYMDIKNCVKIHKNLDIGEGEAAVMTLAHINNGIAASNNLADVYPFYDKYNFKILTSSFILAVAVDNGIIQFEEAEKIYLLGADYGFKLPDDTFSKYYNETYGKDKEFMDIVID